MIRLSQAAQPQILEENGEEWTAKYVTWCGDRFGNEPRHYRHSDIRIALESETNSKCAYCEARINHVSYAHIEHKLPKRKHPRLVCDWTNLTIACSRCNTKKGDYDEPVCPLLDPYVDDVENLVVFYGPLALAKGSPRARATITRLALNRVDLLFARAESITNLNRLLDFLERAQDEPDALHSIWLEINSLISAEGEFASACRYFLELQIVERQLTRP